MVLKLKQTINKYYTLDENYLEERTAKRMDIMRSTTNDALIMKKHKRLRGLLRLLRLVPSHSLQYANHRNFMDKRFDFFCVHIMNLLPINVSSSDDRI